MNRQLAITITLASVLAGCGPYNEERFRIVPPDASAHVIMMQGADEQQKLEGVQQQAVQVYAKRVVIPTTTQDLGRGLFNYRYIPAVKVITTSRRPVFRLWTEGLNKGTSTRNEAFHFESLDSINFHTGGVIIARVEYEHTAAYRYKYPGKPLEQVIDTDVHGFLQEATASKFGKLEFRATESGTPDCLNQAIPVFQEAMGQAQKYFADFGITIDYFGNVGGLSPDNKDRQLALDRTYIQTMNVEVQEERNKEQAIRNRMKVSLAETESQSAALLYEAQDAAKLRQLFAAALAEERALNDAAMKWGSVTVGAADGQFTAGGRGKLPSSLMPADVSPLSWIQGRISVDPLETLPRELDPELARRAQERVAQIQVDRAKENVVP